MGRFTASWAGRPWTYDDDCWDHQQSIGVALTGAGLAWCDVQPEPPADPDNPQASYDWNRIAYADHEVDGILARGMEPTFFLGLTPAWAALRPDLPPHRTPPAEEYVDEFMDFHRWVADRYKDKVRYYYFWNEPNGCSWINEGCANGDSYPLYTQWLIRCSQAVREMDPDARIIAANIDYHSGVTRGYEYIQGMYDHGAGPWFDIISIHPYDWSGTIHWQAVTDTRAVMVANGDADKPVWISEFGWDSTNYQSTADKLTFVLTELKKPEWSFVQMASYLVLNDGAGVENYGLMDANLNPRAGYFAYRDLDKTWPETVDFSADVTAGAVPLAVQFTDQSTVPEATDWLWDFGDGQTSDQRHPLHTYVQEGSFTVQLTVTAPGGTENGLKQDYIRVGGFPKVAFIGGQLPPTEADAGVIAHLRGGGLLVDVYDDDRANRPGASEIASSHDLVIGSSTLLSANVAGDFRYEPVPFIFWESALAWCGSPDNRECIANGPTAIGGQTQIDVIDNTHRIMEGIPTGVVTLTHHTTDFSYCTSTVAPGAKVLATGVGYAGRKTIIVVEPGDALLDGGVAAGKRVMLYLYDTTWSATNDTGKAIFDNAVAYALGEPAASFSADSTIGPPPFTVQFTDESTGPVTGWRWDFGDGVTSTLRHPSHTYALPGTYDVSLSVSGPGGPDVWTRWAYINVTEPIQADFDGDNDVDQADFGHLQACLTGAGAGPPAAGCANADLDTDNDVDQDDFELFHRCLAGADVPPLPGCAG